ncbi:MAG: hypothetical protein SGPRY_000643 [Prymnesium sp.]
MYPGRLLEEYAPRLGRLLEEYEPSTASTASSTARSTARSTASSTASTALVFEDRGANDRVQNTIGDVAVDTTVAQLLALRTVPNLLAEMLSVSRAPVASGFGLTLLNFPTEAQVGATLQVNGTVTDAFTGAPTALSMPSAQSRVVDLSYSLSASVPAQLSTYSFDVAVAHGAEAAFERASVLAGSLTSSVQLHSFAPVYYGADLLNDTPADPSNSGLPSTSRVFADTAEVIVVSHVWNDTIFVPKQPVEVSQYESALFRDFIVLQPSVTNITQVDKVVGGATLTYYAIEFPVFRAQPGSVLDKRSYGTALDRPSALSSGVGLLRYEDKADSTPTSADWPKWVYWDGSAWQDLETQPQIDPNTLYTGPVDMNAVGDSSAIVRTAVGAVSEGTTKSALEAQTVLNLLAQILNVGPEIGIMPVVTGVGAVYTVSPVDAQIGTNHTFAGQPSGDVFPTGNAISVTMTDPFDGSTIAFTGGGNTFDFIRLYLVVYYIPRIPFPTRGICGSASHQVSSIFFSESPSNHEQSLQRAQRRFLSMAPKRPLSPTLGEGLLGVVPRGVLVGARPAAFASSHAVHTAPEQTDPRQPGSLDEFSVAHSADPLLLEQLRNKVKKCAACGKVCGFSLSVCNSCGKPLPADVTSSANIFMSFIYGIAKASFPLSISIRQQTEDLLVFDDLLALTPCHLNVIPTTCHIPDWRFLLTQPARGLKLLSDLEDAAWGCVVDHFITKPAWASKMLRTGPARTRRQIADFRPHMVAGCNFPPSQFQLHIQYFLPPFLPYQYQMYLNGCHLTHKRFFPLEYITQVLALNEPVEVTVDTDVDSLVERFKDRVNYDAIHAACYKRVGASHSYLANWKPEDFEHVLEKGATQVAGMPKDQVVESDKVILQSYGRPYSEAGKPTGTFYKFTRSDRVPTWADGEI